MTNARVWIERLAPKSGFVRNVAVLAGGTGIGQAIAALASPILTRLYTPEDFGVLVVFTAILGIVVVFSTLRYNLAIPLPDDDIDAANVLVLSLAIVVLLSVLTALAFGTLGDEIAIWTNAPMLKPYYWLLPLGVLAVGVYQSLNYWAVRKKKFVHLGITKISQGVGTVIIQLAFGLIKLAPLGLLLGHVVGQAAGTSTLALLAWRHNGEAIKRVKLAGIYWAANRYRRFPIYYMPAALLTTAWLQIPALVIAAFYEPKIAGLFALGQLVLGAPMTLLGNSVGQVYLGEAAELARQGLKALYKFFVSTSIRLFFLGAIPIGLIGLGGPNLFGFVFGPEWPEAGLYVQILAPSFLLRFTVSPMSQTLSVHLERQDLFFVVSIVRIVVNIGTLLVACWLGANPPAALGFYSGSVALIYLCHFALIFYAFRKCIRNGFNKA